ncbi:MAG: hypothetical protein AB7C89_08625 [Intestinibacillus sp.]
MTQMEKAGAPAEADIFNGEAAARSAEPAYEIPVDGQTLRLTLPQLIEAAQAGLTKRNQGIRRDGAARAVPNGQIYASFLAEYPDVQPSDIPPEVWEQAAREGSLVSAYRGYELQRLRAELAALQKNRENRAGEIGPAASDGETPAADPVVRALLGSR